MNKPTLDTPASDSPLLCPHCGSRCLDAIAPHRNKKANPIPLESRVCKPRHVAEAICRSQAHIYDQIKKGRIGVVTVNGAIRIRIPDAISYICSITVGGAR